MEGTKYSILEEPVNLHVGHNVTHYVSHRRMYQKACIECLLDYRDDIKLFESEGNLWMKCRPQ